jgi:YD repeat-containing protein
MKHALLFATASTLAARTLMAVTLGAATLTVGCSRPAYAVKSDAAKASMRGNVRQLTETVFDVTDDRQVMDSYTVVIYNRAGNVTLTDLYKGPDSVYVSRDEYHYDPTGERMERHLSRDKVRGRYTETIYRHDDAGRLVMETDAWHGWRAHYTYDRHGYPRARIDTTLNVDEEIRYRYDRLGRLKSERYKKGNGPTKRYTYHGDGDVVAQMSLGQSNIDRYDERGELVSMTVNAIEKRNRRGRVTKSFPVTLTAVYEYDTHGNWVRRTLLYKGETQTVAVREYDYYDR